MNPLDAADEQLNALCAPPPTLLVSEWAERNRVIPKGTSARPGPWITESYEREMMDAVLDPDVRRVVCVKSTQVGFTECLLNVLGYYIDADPQPILIVVPTDQVAKDYSKKRIAPMIAASPALKAKVRQPSTKRSGNTLQLKEFDGGFLKIAGANSGAGLRSDPIAVLLLDEVDGYPADVNGEGSPIDIAERRTDSYPDAKIILGSTPGKPRGFSKIEQEYELTDKRRYHVPCPFCDEYQPLVWRDEDGNYRLVWEKNEHGDPIPNSVLYLCAHCGEGIAEKHKLWMLERGQWIATHPERKDVVGFRLNALYQPWRSVWPDLAQKWTEAQDNPEKLKAFVNLQLGEAWVDPSAEVIKPSALAARRERYAAEVPSDCCVLVAAADIQNNRIEAQVMGFGAGEESWLIAHEVFWGNPGVATDPDTGQNAWEQLDQFLLRTWQHECGTLLAPAITLIDSGSGGHADSVYDYVLPRQNTRRRIFASKGVDYLSKPGLVAEGATKRHHVRLWTVGTYAAKDRILARLKIQKPGPDFHHLPDWTTDEYLEQLTSEQKVMTRDRLGRVRFVYQKLGHARNEALDLTVYCHAALAVLQQLDGTYRDLARLLQVFRAGMTLSPARPVRKVRSKVF